MPSSQNGVNLKYVSSFFFFFFFTLCFVLLLVLFMYLAYREQCRIVCVVLRESTLGYQKFVMFSP